MHLGSALENLDVKLTQLVNSPNTQYLDLFKLQRLTRMALALDLFVRICGQSPGSVQRDDGLHMRALDCSRKVADIVIRQILRILNSGDNANFEENVNLPSKVLEQLSALFKHAPMKLDKYNYFYGLLDCASQLSTIIEPARYPVGFDSRMKLIIARSKEDSFRWKAVCASSSWRSSRALYTSLMN